MLACVIRAGSRTDSLRAWRYGAAAGACGLDLGDGIVCEANLDMLLVVADSSDEQSYIPALEAAGYTLRIREPEWFEHRLLKGPDTDVNLHVFGKGSPEAKRMLRFRDWLRANDADRNNYASVKRSLAQQVWGNVQDYADAKTPVIQEIMNRANASA